MFISHKQGEIYFANLKISTKIITKTFEHSSQNIPQVDLSNRIKRR
jgi:hypothetical protein